MVESTSTTKSKNLMRRTHSVHVDRLGGFVDDLHQKGYHAITIHINTCSADAFNTGIADVQILELGEQYDRAPVEAGRN